MIKLLLYCAACALMAGCASVPSPEQIELVPEPDFTLSYRGGIGEAADAVLDEFPEWRGPEGGESRDAVDLLVRVLRLSRAGSAELLGEGGNVVGVFSLSEAEIEALLNIIEAREDCAAVSSPHLVAIQDQTCTLEISRQVAYIGGFEFDAVEDSIIADPTVHTATDGMKVAFKASFGEDGTLTLDFDFGVAELVSPMPARHVRAFNTDMYVQTPMMTTQRLKGSGKLAKGRVLALTGLESEGDTRLLILVKAAPFKITAPEPKDD